LPEAVESDAFIRVEAKYILSEAKQGF
jgi:hypothetical protein